MYNEFFSGAEAKHESKRNNCNAIFNDKMIESKEMEMKQCNAIEIKLYKMNEEKKIRPLNDNLCITSGDLII